MVGSRSDVGGTNWDTKLVLDSGYAGVAQITCAGEDVYVTGQTSDSVVSTGLILGSSDHGATWNTDFESTNEFYFALSSDSDGNVYSAGTTSTNANPNYSYNWLLRKGIPGSNNWTTVDQFSYSGSPQSVAVDAAGNICVAGHSSTNYIIGTTNGYSSYPIWNWVARQYSVANGQWSTSDFFSYSTNVSNMLTTATGAAIAPDGSTFVVGWGTSNSGQRHWLVRKRGGPPRLQIAVGTAGVTVSWPAGYTNATLEWADSADVNRLWHGCTNTVNVVGDCCAAAFNLAPGARLFRLKTAGQ